MEPTRAHSRRRRAAAVAGVLAAAAALAACVLAAGSGTVAPHDSAATTLPTPAAPPSVKAWSGILVDRRTGVVLWQKSPHRRLPPASCTKIMTALLVLERVDDLSRYARVPDIPYPQHVGVGLRPGDRITVWQALKALMVKSANDAALTLAAHVAGSEQAFVRLMNRRAARMGLRDTHFANCRGTPEPGHYSCAADLARLGRVAMRDARFRLLVGMKRTVVRYPPDNAVPVESHNRLLDYPWGDGIKTGATSASGKVLVGSGRPGLVPLIVVTMHEPTRDQEERDAVALLQWGSSLYRRVTLASAGDAVATVPLAGGGAVRVVAAATVTGVVRHGARVEQRVTLPDALESLPPDGSILGRVSWWSDDLRLGRIRLLAAGLASPSPASSPAPPAP